MTSNITILKTVLWRIGCKWKTKQVPCHGKSATIVYISKGYYSKIQNDVPNTKIIKQHTKSKAQGKIGCTVSWLTLVQPGLCGFPCARLIMLNGMPVAVSQAGSSLLPMSVAFSRKILSPERSNALRSPPTTLLKTWTMNQHIVLVNTHPYLVARDIYVCMTLCS